MGRHSTSIEYENNLMKVVVTNDLYDPLKEKKIGLFGTQGI